MSLVDPVEVHLRQLEYALRRLQRDAGELHDWGVHLALTLARGGRLLTAGNGGSAAHAQHLVAELVGRFDGERAPLPAVALTADSVITSALGNDYGYDEVFARQVRAHGRPGDVVLLLSTSGTSPNVVAAARAAREVGASAWSMTGPVPNPLAAECDRFFAVPAPSTQIVQEVHQVAVHVLCGFIDEVVRSVLPAEAEWAEPAYAPGAAR
ncbi:MAG: SIS domain-containing protein [Hamadaea sp.]|nr:SIS domain-containing protein [Hamadaea sp.]